MSIFKSKTIPKSLTRKKTMNKNTTFRKSDIPIPENYLETEIDFNEKKDQKSPEKSKNSNQKNQSKNNDREKENVIDLSSIGLGLGSIDFEMKRSTVINRSESLTKQVIKNRIPLFFSTKGGSFFESFNSESDHISRERFIPYDRHRNRRVIEKKKKIHIVDEFASIVSKEKHQMKNPTTNKKINRVFYNKISYGRDAMTMLIINRHLNDIFMFENLSFNDIATAIFLYMLMSDSKKRKNNKTAEKILDSKKSNFIDQNVFYFRT